MIEDIFHDLPFDLTGPAPAFRPYTFKAEKALAWARANWLPIALFIAGAVVA